MDYALKTPKSALTQSPLQGSDAASSGKNATVPLRVLMVEDSPHWQEAIQSLVGMIPGLTLLSCVDNFEDALAFYNQNLAGPSEARVNLALLDFQIQGAKSGLDVAKALCAKGFAQERIVIVSSSPPSLIGEHPYGYVPKSRVFEELPVAIAGIANLPL